MEPPELVQEGGGMVIETKTTNGRPEEAQEYQVEVMEILGASRSTPRKGGSGRARHYATMGYTRSSEPHEHSSKIWPLDGGDGSLHG